MNLDDLNKAYQDYNAIIRLKNKSKKDKLKARKKLVLSELEAALVIDKYNETLAESVKSRGKTNKKDIIKNNNDKEINKIDIFSNNYSIKLINYNSYSDNSSNNLINYLDNDIRPKREPKDDLTSSKEQTISYLCALNDVRLNAQFKKYRRQLDDLEEKDDLDGLEAILNASHNVAMDGHATEYMNVFDFLPTDKDRVLFSLLTSRMIKENSILGFNPLMMRLSQIKSASFCSKKDNETLSNDLLTEDTKIKPTKKSEEWVDNSIKINSSILDDLDGLYRIKELSYKDLLLDENLYSINSIDKRNSFFSDVREIYQNLGSEIGRRWLERSIEILDNDNKKGNVFVNGSRHTLETYVGQLDWGVDELVSDFNEFGTDLFKVNRLIIKYSGLNKNRKRMLVRTIIDNLDSTTLEEFDLYKDSYSEEIDGILPDELTEKELLLALRKTSQLGQIISSNIDGRFIKTRLKRRKNKSKNIEEYLSFLDDIGSRTQEYIDFIEEQRKDPNMNLGLKEKEVQLALELYEDYLGKNFTQFQRDYRSIGTDIQKIPKIKEKYGKYMQDDKLIPVLNYITKSRSRDLINILSSTNVSDPILSTTINKLNNASKEETVKTLRELSKTYFILQNIGKTIDLENTINEIESSPKPGEVMEAIIKTRKQLYSEVTRSSLVPEELEEMIDNVVVGYYKNSGSVHKVPMKKELRFLTSIYLKHGKDKAYEAIGRLKRNRELSSKLTENGVKINEFREGIDRTYHVSTDEESINRLKERINSEVDQVYDRLKSLYEIKKESDIDPTSGVAIQLEDKNPVIDDPKIIAEKERLENLAKEIEGYKQGNLREQLENIEKFIGSYEFNETNKALKDEIKGHIQTARSLTGTIKEMDTDARFYVSNDPLESLHMGQYFNSCLSLSKHHGGCNGWASVVQTMDINKNVIYAVSEEGKYLGRNRTALTDKGILCTRFYHNGDMNLNNAWIDYLTDFAVHTDEEVMIPTIFATPSMDTELNKRISSGEVKKETREVYIEPAYYSKFYGDGLTIETSNDGKLKINTEVYVLAP